MKMVVCTDCSWIGGQKHFTCFDDVVCCNQMHCLTVAFHQFSSIGFDIVALHMTFECAYLFIAIVIHCFVWIFFKFHLCFTCLLCLFLSICLCTYVFVRVCLTESTQFSIFVIKFVNSLAKYVCVHGGALTLDRF